jgi:hypothetical protein
MTFKNRLGSCRVKTLLVAAAFTAPVSQKTALDPNLVVASLLAGPDG